MKKLVENLQRFPKIRRNYKLLLVIFSIATLWVLGILDHFQETSFKSFNWPPPDSSQIRFQFPIQIKVPKCEFSSKISQKLLIIVKSSLENWNQRQLIRETWGKHAKHQTEIEVSTIFIVGQPKENNFNIQNLLKEEYLTYADLLIIDSIDSYRNNTYKLFAGLDYSENPSNCSASTTILLIDDDYMVHIPNLVTFVKSKNSNNLIYEGFVFNTSPFRFSLHKHQISLQEYPFNQYPPYVSAGAVFLTTKTANLFKLMVPKLKLFPFDDVYTGIIAKMVNISPNHNENFVFWSRNLKKSEWESGIICAHGYKSDVFIKEYNKIYK